MDEAESIMEVKLFMDQNGFEVKQFTPVFGKDKNVSFYKGRVMVKVQPVGPNGPMPPQVIPFEFTFPENTKGLKMAFETFKRVADIELAEWKKQQQEKAVANRIIPAAAMPAIMGPDGKPMGLKG